MPTSQAFNNFDHVSHVFAYKQQQSSREAHMQIMKEQADRKERKLQERVQQMLAGSGIPKRYRKAAFNTANTSVQPFCWEAGEVTRWISITP